MMNQKGLTPLLIVILIALAVGGYLIYQKQTQPISTPLPQQITQSSPQPNTSPALTGVDETANWKVYTNEKNRFTFKYPPRFKLLNSPPKELEVQFEIEIFPDTPYFKSNDNQYPSYMHIEYVLEGTGNLGDYRREVSKRTIVVAGKKIDIRVVDWTSSPPLEKWQPYYVQLGYVPVPDNKGVYQLSLVYHPLVYLEAEKEFDQILSTFKFQ